MVAHGVNDAMIIIIIITYLLIISSARVTVRQNFWKDKWNKTEAGILEQQGH